jgi:hypothetical protein
MDPLKTTLHLARPGGQVTAPRVVAAAQQLLGTADVRTGLGTAASRVKR